MITFQQLDDRQAVTDLVSRLGLVGPDRRGRGHGGVAGGVGAD